MATVQPTGPPRTVAPEPPREAKPKREGVTEATEPRALRPPESERPAGQPPRVPGRFERPWLEPLTFGPDVEASALTRTYTREGALVPPEEGGIDLFKRKRPMLDVLA